MKELLVNAIMTPDGTYLESRHRHDFQSHKDTISTEEYTIDGGLCYTRGSINTWAAKDMRVYTTDPHETIRKSFRWGTFGIDGDGPKKLVVLKDLTSKHIENILDYCKPQGKIRKVFMDELQYRLDNDLASPEEDSY